MKAREKAYVQADGRRQACADWIKAFMKPGQTKPATKGELFDMAKAELDINRSNFDAGWIQAIEEMGRQDWYEPLPRRSRTSQ